MTSNPDREYTVTFLVDGVPQEHALTGDRQLVGRAKHCELCFPFNSEISRLHATLSLQRGVWTVEDMASRSGTYVNSEKLDKPRRLSDRDVLAIGDVKLTFRAKRYGDGTVDSAELISAIQSVRHLVEDQTDDARRSPAAPARSRNESHEINYYELLGVQLFERDMEVISQAGKRRLGELREGSAAQDTDRLKAITGEVSKAVVCLTHPQLKQEYDLQLAEELGCDVEVRSDGVVPKDRVAPESILVGIAIIVAVCLVAWFGGKALMNVITPFWDVRNMY